MVKSDPPMLQLASSCSCVREDGLNAGMGYQLVLISSLTNAKVFFFCLFHIVRIVPPNIWTSSPWTRRWCVTFSFKPSWLTWTRVRETPIHAQHVFNTLRECGTLPSAHVSSEGARKQNMEEQENILDMVQRSPTTSSRRLAARVGVSRTRVWRTLHEDGLYPFHP